MKVMSFNILCGCHIKGQDWFDRAPWVVAAIKDQAPDVFGVQEAHSDWMKTLISSLEDYYYVGIGRDDGADRGEYSPVFYRKDAYNLLDCGHFWLSESPDRPGKGWDAACVRICSWARLIEKKTGRTFVHMNTHLDHVGRVAMLEGAKLIAAHAARFDCPVIVTGDLNVTPDSEPAAVIKAVCPDTRDTAPGADRGITFHDYDNIPPECQSVIDYVCQKGFTPKSFTVDRFEFEGKRPSDHFPVVAELEWDD